MSKVFSFSIRTSRNSKTLIFDVAISGFVLFSGGKQPQKYVLRLQAVLYSTNILSRAFQQRETESAAPSAMLRQLWRSLSLLSSLTAEKDNCFTHFRSSSIMSPASRFVYAVQYKIQPMDTQNVWVLHQKNLKYRVAYHNHGRQYGQLSSLDCAIMSTSYNVRPTVPDY